ncbi:hypothetical protein I3842_05G137400 [Carya illinoinensis]|uniref:Small multi-drug export n=1 Tax=Carya illinoinensis TaxID=32201 RepID=A0A922F4L6_CARIL|nr:hypothetical protein I3842_05G137400 [Carya illinoinensis]
MAASLPSSASPLTSTFSTRKTHLKFTLNHDHSSVVPIKQHPFKSGLHLTFQVSHHFGPLLVKRASSDGVFDAVEENGTLPSFEERPVKLLLLVIFWASVSLAWFAASGDANAASDSIIASSFGLKIASKLRSWGWPDAAVVFALATLPVLELRGAIPVGYWMQLKPVVLTILSILGNMVPVPIIILYLKKFASFLAGRNRSASRFLDMLFESAKKKAGPVEEFQWLGLMLFVAVPFPGTGAWTGAIIASILEMPFWSAVSANFCGVVLAGLLVNLLVNLGVKYAIVTGVILFFISTFMWSILRNFRTSSSSLK